MKELNRILLMRESRKREEKKMKYLPSLLFWFPRKKSQFNEAHLYEAKLIGNSCFFLDSKHENPWIRYINIHFFSYLTFSKRTNKDVQNGLDCLLTLSLLPLFFCLGVGPTIVRKTMTAENKNAQLFHSNLSFSQCHHP